MHSDEEFTHHQEIWKYIKDDTLVRSLLSANSITRRLEWWEISNDMKENTLVGSHLNASIVTSPLARQDI